MVGVIAVITAAQSNMFSLKKHISQYFLSYRTFSIQSSIQAIIFNFVFISSNFQQQPKLYIFWEKFVAGREYFHATNLNSKYIKALFNFHHFLKFVTLHKSKFHKYLC